jgi:nucleotide-binding universal stress UspA family protein
MQKIQTVMAAVDFSDYSLPVLRQATDICKAFSAGLLMVNVINQRDVDALKFVEAMSSLSDFSPTSFIQEQELERTKNMRSLLQQINGETPRVDFVIMVGVPFEQLIRAVQENNADLVVMGPKGRGNLAHVFFGTTAEKMFRHCPVSLLSVRENGNYDRNRMKS